MVGNPHNGFCLHGSMAFKSGEDLERFYHYIVSNRGEISHCFFMNQQDENETISFLQKAGLVRVKELNFLDFNGLKISFCSESEMPKNDLFKQMLSKGFYYAPVVPVVGGGIHPHFKKGAEKILAKAELIEEYLNAENQIDSNGVH